MTVCNMSIGQAARRHDRSRRLTYAYLDAARSSQGNASRRRRILEDSATDAGAAFGRELEITVRARASGLVGERIPEWWDRDRSDPRSGIDATRTRAKQLERARVHGIETGTAIKK